MVSPASQDQSEDVWSRPNWSPRVEKIFVQLLIEEMSEHLGYLLPNGFKDNEWDRVCGEFNKQTGLNFDKKELKKHLTVLRKRYYIVKPLYDQRGFGWDNRRKMVVVHDLVWPDYIEAHPKIEPYRKWGCPLYEDLRTIFTKPPSMEKYAALFPSSYNPLCSMLPRENNHNLSGAHKRQREQPLSSGPKKKTNTGDKMQKKYADPGAGDVSVSQNDDPYSLECCIREINGMQGVDNKLYDAGLKLFQNAYWRKTFVSMKKSEDRLGWLKAMQTCA